MDPASAVVMVILSCTPDMLLCRPAEAKPASYSSLFQCQEALRERLQAPVPPNDKIIGRCQTVGQVGAIASWRVTPDGDLVTAETVTAVESAPPIAAIDSTTTTALPAQDGLGRPEGHVVVRVTRGLGPDAVTTGYLVPRQ